jgi:hypothetical protein
VTSVFKVSTFSDSDNNLDDLLQNMWKLDKVGIAEPSIDNDPAMLNFKDSLRFVDGKYCASLPWKNSHPPLPNNKLLALKRLNSLWKSLLNKPATLKHYNDVISEQLKMNFIEEVSCNSNDFVNKIHYLPHHAVAKDSPTTPVRVVFDCSAKLGNDHPSLNDCLLTGPDMLNDLTSILLRFRMHRYAATADIAKAFLNVQLSENDRDCCRFFWPENPFDPNSEIKIYRFKVVLFGSTASQFLLNSTISHHLNKYNNETSSAIARNIYVDDVHFTGSEEPQLINFYNESCKIMSEGGFVLREWKSNSPVLNSLVGEGEEKVSNENPEVSKLNNNVKVLGIPWDVNDDSFSVRELPKQSNEVKITKRFIVSQIAKIFDPYGLLLPITVRGKLFIQKLWKQKLSWDELLPLELVKEWDCFFI